MNAEAVFVWATNNWEMISAILVAIIGVVESFRRCAAQKDALHILADAIEATSSGAAKAHVTKIRTPQSKLLNNAILKAVAAAQVKAK